MARCQNLTSLCRGGAAPTPRARSTHAFAHKACQRDAAHKADKVTPRTRRTKLRRAQGAHKAKGGASRTRGRTRGRTTFGELQHDWTCKRPEPPRLCTRPSPLCTMGVVHKACALCTRGPAHKAGQPCARPPRAQEVHTRSRTRRAQGRTRPINCICGVVGVLATPHVFMLLSIVVAS